MTSSNTGKHISSLTDSSIIFSFEQTACFGTCPVHKMVVYHNRYATYQGKRHVAQIGNYFATLSPAQIAHIYQKAEDLDFFTLDTNYSANMTDLPTTIITVNNGTQNKTVSAYGSYPANLQKFMEFLGINLQSIVWTKIK
ncbi:MAG: DUF6438 domain-containing protein [Salibacteraceae bacterium]